MNKDQCEFYQEYQRWVNKGACGVIEDICEIEEDFHKSLVFGTGGIRAIMGPGPNKLNKYTIRKNTEGYANYLLAIGDESKTKGVVIAYDNRRNSELFAREAAKVLATHDIKVFLFDRLRPTPELSFAVRELGAAGGINITASHNPPEYNGYKTYDEFGCQSVLRDTDRIIKFINQVKDPLAITVDDTKDDNIILIGEEIDRAYYAALKSVTQRPDLKKDITIVYSPLHGTGNIPVRHMLCEMGYKVIPVENQCSVDPDFSNTKSPNPENPKSFEEAIKIAHKEQADIIIATDPDCDRMGVAVLHDSEYKCLTGNQIGAILIEYLLSSKKENDSLPSNGIIFDTVVTSPLGRRIASSYGIETESTLTGFKFIGDKIREYEGKKKFLFGYEESYGCMIGTFTRDKDGVQASMLVAEAAQYYKNMGKTLIDILNDIFSRFGHLQEMEYSETLPGIEGAKKIQNIVEQYRNGNIDEIEGRKISVKEDYLTGVRYGKNGYSGINLPKTNMIRFVLDDGSIVAIRPSGNEPKIKYYKYLWG